MTCPFGRYLHGNDYNQEMTNMAKTISMTQEELSKLIAEGVAQAMAAEREKVAAEAAARPKGRSEQSLRNEDACIRAFARAGFGNVTPHVDVLTFNKWLDQGYRVKKGEQSVAVKSLRLFHKSQVEKVSAEELAQLRAKQKETFDQHQAKKTQRRREQVAAASRRYQERRPERPQQTEQPQT
jgi:hypothetical protein